MQKGLAQKGTLNVRHMVMEMVGKRGRVLRAELANLRLQLLARIWTGRNTEPKTAS